MKSCFLSVVSYSIIRIATATRTTKYAEEKELIRLNMYVSVLCLNLEPNGTLSYSLLRRFGFYLQNICYNLDIAITALPLPATVVLHYVSGM